jgi:hypothetical protein
MQSTINEQIQEHVRALEHADLIAARAFSIVFSTQSSKIPLPFFASQVRRSLLVFGMAITQGCYFPTIDTAVSGKKLYKLLWVGPYVRLSALLLFSLGNRSSAKIWHVCHLSLLLATHTIDLDKRRVFCCNE